MTVSEEDQSTEAVSEGDVEDQSTEAVSEGDVEDQSTDDEPADEVEADADEVVVTIGDTPTTDVEESQKAPQWVKELRKSHRDTQRENRELKQKLESLESPATPAATLGVKPKLEDFDYDTERYEQSLSTWYDRKREVDAQEASTKAAQEKEKADWQAKLNDYGAKKSSLKVRDFDDAEAAVLELLNQTQQGIVIQGADNPAVTIYALGKNSEKLKELSAVKDPVKFAFAVAKLETQLKVKNRKAPPPERTVSGTAPKSGAVDSNLERLREEAEKSGDYSKVHRYKKQQKLKAK